ncbi:MAG: type I polyketide synthase, partial [Steroidobacteraceae bacterium]
MAEGLLKRPGMKLEADSNLAEFGFDSIGFTELANLLSDFYRLALMPTLFFEHSTLRRVASHLVKSHRAQLEKRHHDAVVESPYGTRSDAAPNGAAEPVEHTAPEHPTVASSRGMPTDPAAGECSALANEPIAIIGMSCCFPMAESAAAFWENLRNGRDCIREVPHSRWDWKALYGDPLQDANRTNIKWGGFIDGIDEFDPLFFGISPREAELMDPQQRLLMTHAWWAIEEAGYAPKSLAGTKTAVFVGLQANDYVPAADLSSSIIESYSSTGRIPSVGPNRVSYFFDFHGPSEPIDTACSSALVAIHRAVQCIRSGESELALTGGIYTIVRPDYHISFSKAGMLCEDGRCKTFSKHANGYVRGEGIGILLLKRLSAAERDGDHIHGLIRGSAENHGGRANSLTAPNPIAQAELLQSAYRDAMIDPRTVTYVEAHGTGTRLGDP